ncbi:hypothetical protein BDC45DRAFT_563716 [Circinella umbellata]|nr:hypothetical protein BDC45DRAFT_563716 [Circinella umbellata]
MTMTTTVPPTSLIWTSFQRKQKVLSEEEKQLYTSRAQSFNNRKNLVEGFLNKDEHIVERAAVTEECLNIMQLQVKFLHKRCSIDPFFVFESKMVFNPQQQTTRIGTKAGMLLSEDRDQFLFNNYTKRTDDVKLSFTFRRPIATIRGGKYAV